MINNNNRGDKGGVNRGDGTEEEKKEKEKEEKEEKKEEKKFLRTGTHTDQSKVVQEVLADLE